MPSSKSTSRFVAEHRVERWSGDLCEPGDLALGHPGSDCHVGESPDGFALLRGLATGGESGAPVLGEFGAELCERIVTHPCIVLDKRSCVKYFTPMTKTEQPKTTTSIEHARQCAACSQWLVFEGGKWVGHHPRNCTIVLAGRA